MLRLLKETPLPSRDCSPPSLPFWIGKRGSAAPSAPQGGGEGTQHRALGLRGCRSHIARRRSFLPGHFKNSLCNLKKAAAARKIIIPKRG